MKRFIRFNSQVSRRIFLMVLFSSLVPIAGLVGLTYYNVRSQLMSEAANRLHISSKNIVMAIMAELNKVEKILKQEVRTQRLITDATQLLNNDRAMPEDPFLKIFLFSENGVKDQTVFPHSSEVMERLNLGKSQIIVAEDKPGKPEKIWLLLSGLDRNGRSTIVAGQINSAYLSLHALALLPPNAQVALVDTKLKPLFNFEFEPKITFDAIHAIQEDQTRYAEVAGEGSVWLVGSRNVFLRPSFNAPSWYVLVGEPKNLVFSTLFRFTRNAGMTSLLTFWIILLASSILVRKTLLPLSLLQEATQQVGAGNFDCRVDFSSGDEFEELSESFNQMAAKISAQMQFQENMGKSIRQVLGATEQKEIIENFLNSLSGLVTTNLASFVILDKNLNPNSKLWLSQGPQLERYQELQIDPVEFEQHLPTEDYFCFSDPNNFPYFLQPLVSSDSKHCLLFPVGISSRIQGILTFSYEESTIEQDELLVLGQLADQLRVALAKAAMVEELDLLNFGILTALARTVDANSEWTHGHSERVTQYALSIAEEMGLDEDTRIEIHRAGLLHDLGKIAVSPLILNKPEKLTEEEFAIIKLHPFEGARILEPIRVFDKIRPAIEQHHECWNGTGYPAGLKGEEIHPIARILAVADVYDALYADRPYREGWAQERVFNYLIKESGGEFDPQVVQALFKAIQKVEGLPAKWARKLNKEVLL